MSSKKNNLMTDDEIMQVSLTIGELMLINGAETYRVEETMGHIFISQGITDVQPFVTPTLIMVGRADTQVSLRRIYSRTNNLSKVAALSDISYRFKNWTKNFSETMVELHLINIEPSYSNNMQVMGGAFGSAFFTMMIGGSFYDFLATLVTVIIAMKAAQFINKIYPSPFLTTLVGGVALAAVAVTANTLSPLTNLDKVIVGSIMPFLPGVAFTNGLRDFLYGDLISGNSRIAEALLSATSLAVGVGFALQFAIWQGRIISWTH